MKCGSTPAPGTVAGVVGFVLQRSPVCFGLCTGAEGSPALNEFSVFFGCLPLQGPRGHLEGGYIWKEATFGRRLCHVQNFPILLRIWEVLGTGHFLLVPSFLEERQRTFSL